MPLTAQQKAENKAATRVRDKAHTARARALRLAVKTSEADPDVIAAHEAAEAADAAFKADLQQRDQQARALREQIAALQSQIESLRKDPAFDVLNERRRAANTTWLDIRHAKVAEAEAQFPDMAGDAQFSAAVWTPPQDVVTAMEEARRSARATDLLASDAVPQA